MSAPASESLRTDAQENRRRIIDASRALFSERGLDVPMKAIARRADVGMATLYRRFPTRQDLLSEVFAEQFAECAQIIETALADPDPWHGLCSVIEGVAAMQAADQGFSAAFVHGLPQSTLVEDKLAIGMHGVQNLVSRAKKTGQLRSDFVFEDLALLLLANGGVVGQGGAESAAASKRLVAYMIETFQNPGRPRRPLPAPVELSLPSVVFPEVAPAARSNPRRS